MSSFTIDAFSANQRLDKFLLRKYNAIPKSLIYKLLRKKTIKLNKKKATGAEIIQEGDEVSVFISETTEQSFIQEKSAPITQGNIDIIFEDENIILCNKPAGLLTHPSFPEEDSVTERARAYFHSGDFSPVAVNRLDRNTSGIVILAKNLPAAQCASKMLKNRTIDKYYYALVHGEVTKSFSINARLEKNIGLNKVFITEDGKNSETEVVPVFSSKDCSLLEIKLVTGRTHQIRVHLSSAGFPIFGDKKYGANDNLPFQLLHCRKIVFNEKNGFLSYLYGKEFICEIDWACKK
ncbi:MAG: RluA family pseudouridine synthase [Clostridiales bacterium]|jgi:23S rRNA pseudouridine955/2504/2580 synthase|nr:RluA family pseudouridine synthase [Clostridiales bacterium]